MAENTMSYQELVARLGEPLVEKHVAGTAGVRSDCFKCGCLRIVRMRIDEMDIGFHPCQVHQKDFAEVTVL